VPGAQGTGRNREGVKFGYGDGVAGAASPGDCPKIHSSTQAVATIKIITTSILSIPHSAAVLGSVKDASRRCAVAFGHP
jgi:hypothetical protein